MTDQVGRYFRQIQRSIDRLSDRVARLESQNRFTTAADWMPGNWWGRCSPTQPASKIIQIHGGVLWLWDPITAAGYFRQLGTTVYDLNMVLPFNFQYHYRWVVLTADLAFNPPSLFLDEDGSEHDTAAEAEADFWQNGPGVDLYGSYFPLTAMVLKNDGALLVAGAVENLTLADTAQSYFLVRDFRPWLHLHMAEQGPS